MFGGSCRSHCCPVFGVCMCACVLVLCLCGEKAKLGERTHIYFARTNGRSFLLILKSKSRIKNLNKKPDVLFEMPAVPAAAARKATSNMWFFPSFGPCSIQDDTHLFSTFLFHPILPIHSPMYVYHSPSPSLLPRPVCTTPLLPPRPPPPSPPPPPPHSHHFQILVRLSLRHSS